uniref:histidine phosphatase family protein n=1 Tax=Limnobacter sp. TaxID=2003368 RepID=UPI00351117C1
VCSSDLAKRLANAMQALPYDHCVSSDLQRAHHTAMAITGAAKPIQLDPNLRERNYGHFSGMTGDEMRAHCPQEFAGLMQRDPESPLRHGESLLSFYQRVIDAFTSHLQAHIGQTVLLVAHGGVLDCIYRHCMDEPLHTPRQWALPNCAINIIDRSPQGDFEVVTWAHTAHLSDDPNTPSLDEVDGRIA